MARKYTPPTYSRVADASRISVVNQAREYAVWLMANGRTHCAVYPLNKSSVGTSSTFREALVRAHTGKLRFTVVNPAAFLGKLTDTDRS